MRGWREGDHFRILTLPTLVELKLASGMTAPHRLKDLADVLELVRAAKLPAELAASLDPYVRAKYMELWRAAQIDDPGQTILFNAVRDNNLKRYDRTRALRFLSLIEDLKPLRLIAVGPDEHAGAVALLRKFSDQDLSLTDAVGLHLMKARNIGTCWSTDFHLRLTGVPLAVDRR